MVANKEIRILEIDDRKGSRNPKVVSFIKANIWVFVNLSKVN
jgi:hypothetical protein